MYAFGARVAETLGEGGPVLAVAVSFGLLTYVLLRIRLWKGLADADGYRAVFDWAGGGDWANRYRQAINGYYAVRLVPTVPTVPPVSKLRQTVRVLLLAPLFLPLIVMSVGIFAMMVAALPDTLMAEADPSARLGWLRIEGWRRGLVLASIAVCVSLALYLATNDRTKPLVNRWRDRILGVPLSAAASGGARLRRGLRWVAVLLVMSLPQPLLRLADDLAEIYGASREVLKAASLAGAAVLLAMALLMLVALFVSLGRRFDLRMIGSSGILIAMGWMAAWAIGLLFAFASFLGPDTLPAIALALVSGCFAFVALDRARRSWDRRLRHEAAPSPVAARRHIAEAVGLGVGKFVAAVIATLLVLSVLDRVLAAFGAPPPDWLAYLAEPTGNDTPSWAAVLAMLSLTLLHAGQHVFAAGLAWLAPRLATHALVEPVPETVAGRYRRVARAFALPALLAWAVLPLCLLMTYALLDAVVAAVLPHNGLILELARGVARWVGGPGATG